MRVLSCLLPICAILSLACGGGAGSNLPAPGPLPPSLGVQPPAATVQSGSIQAFTVSVIGSASSAVTWSVLEAAGGSITAAGVYTAPAGTGSFHVQARLSSDPSLTRQATVTVVAASAGLPALGIAGPLNGYLPFPADNPWNQDISALPADPASAAVVAFVGAGQPLHADFGSGLYNNAPIGIPYAVVAGSQARVPVQVQAYADQSEPGPMPIPLPAPMEGPSPTATSGDRHVLVMDRDNGFLYELYAARIQLDGTWSADSAAIWDLRSNGMRPWGWTSADAAGLPLFPGLAKYEEAASGEIRHALRLTVPTTGKGCIAPASHWASSTSQAQAPAMGARFRLKASKDISGFPAQARVVLQALKTYGMILADNGSAWYLSGCPDPRWDNSDLHTLAGITGSDLELVQTGSVLSTLPSGPMPTILSFTASPATVSPGQSATLSWTSSGASRCFLNPGPGPTRASSQVVAPAATTRYTLLVEGPYGSSTATVTVTVQP